MLPFDQKPEIPVERLKRYLETNEDIDALSAEERARLDIGERDMDRSLRQYVLRKGRGCKVETSPHPVVPTNRGGCFADSIELSAKNQFLTYVEGYAISPDGKAAIHHAWCEDSEGRLIDFTWERRGGRGLAYFGIRFSGEHARKKLNTLQTDCNAHNATLSDPVNYRAIVNGGAPDCEADFQ